MRGALCIVIVYYPLFITAFLLFLPAIIGTIICCCWPRWIIIIVPVMIICMSLAFLQGDIPQLFPDLVGISLCREAWKEWWEWHSIPNTGSIVPSGGAGDIPFSQSSHWYDVGGSIHACYCPSLYVCVFMETSGRTVCIELCWGWLEASLPYAPFPFLCLLGWRRRGLVISTASCVLFYQWAQIVSGVWTLMED